MRALRIIFMILLMAAIAMSATTKRLSTTIRTTTRATITPPPYPSPAYTIIGGPLRTTTVGPTTSSRSCPENQKKDSHGRCHQKL